MAATTALLASCFVEGSIAASSQRSYASACRSCIDRLSQADGVRAQVLRAEEWHDDMT